MNKIMIVAPHPDDETLGCGGTILKHIDNGDEVYWLIVTEMAAGFSDEEKLRRKKEIEKVQRLYGFKDFFECKMGAAKLTTISLGELINSFSDIFNIVKPNVVYIPFKGDIHTDHKIVFDAMAACTKTFRCPSIKKVLCYETISETDFGMDPTEIKFSPNVFVDISQYFAKKLEVMRIYKSELGEHPFPRSEKSIESLAVIRGVAAGTDFAEAFVLLKEIH